jgi:EAL domain-containing protein (putative c-di-GMP-specific phosphodiesterase class I)
MRHTVNTSKIDRSFVAGIGRSPGEAAIVRAVVGLGHSLGIDVVAEGVETEAQAVLLRRLRCKQAQGYLYSKAVPAAEVPVLATCPSATAQSGTIGAVAV